MDDTLPPEIKGSGKRELEMNENIVLFVERHPELDAEDGMAFTVNSRLDITSRELAAIKVHIDKEIRLRGN